MNTIDRLTKAYYAEAERKGIEQKDVYVIGRYEGILESLVISYPEIKEIIETSLEWNEK